jgi:hypothetical protein
MRSATKEERESVDRYIKSIAHKTGIMYMTGDVDYKEDFGIDDIDFFGEHPKADTSNVNRIRINGKVYLAADSVLEIIDKWKYDDTWCVREDIWNERMDAIKGEVLALKGER